MTVSNLALVPAKETAVTEPNIHQMGDAQTKRAHTKSRSMPSLIRYRTSLDFLFDRAEEAGLDALIEPIDPIDPRDMPEYFLNYFNFAVNLSHGMGHASLKLQFDSNRRPQQQCQHGHGLELQRAALKTLGALQTLGEGALLQQLHDAAGGVVEE